MTRTNFFHAWWSGRLVALVVLAGFAFFVSASGARAGCAVPRTPIAARALPGSSPYAAEIPNLQEDDDSRGPVTIVGLWHVTYTAGPAYGGGPFGESLKTWHADGTEFEQAFLAPDGGNICFGVWKDLGQGKAKLHHIGLMFDPGGDITAIFTVDEINTVARDGKTYTGSFDFKIWGSTYASVGDGTPAVEVKGTISATRLTAD